MEEPKRQANSNLNKLKNLMTAKEIWLDKLREKIVKMERYKERDKAMKFNSIFTWYEEGSEVPPLKSGPPAIQGSEVPPFILSISMCRRFEPPPSIDNPLYVHPTFYILSEPQLLARFFRQYRPNEIQDKDKNKLKWES